MNKIVSTADEKQRDLVNVLNKLGDQVDVVNQSIELGPPFGPNGADLNEMSAADLDVTGKHLFYDR